LAVLAAWSAKLKLVSYNPSTNAHLSLTEGMDTFKSIVNERKQNEALILHVPLEKNNKHEAKVRARETDSNIATFYYEESILVRHYLEKLFRHAVTALYSPEKCGSRAAVCFEISNAIYETGFEKALTVVG